MAGVATLQLLTDARHFSAPSFSFLAVDLPQSGMVIDRASDVDEDLLSTGVDYQRWLTMFAQFPETIATTITETATYGAAIDLVRQHIASGSRFADLTIAYGSRTIINRKVKILAPVTSMARIGLVTGALVTGSPGASVVTNWRWKCTEPGA